MTEEKKESFLKRKNIEISAKRYLQDALSAMALGLFASLLIGVIFDTVGVQAANLFGENPVSAFLVEIGAQAKMYMGAAIGVAVAFGLKAPPLVMFASVVTGMMGATMTGFGIEVAGGPAGAFIAVALGAEFGKAVCGETKVDILVTPAVTLFAGGLAAKLAGPAIGWCMIKLGDLIMTATEWQPFLFGIVISIVVGLALTAPISSAAICIMLDLSGLAAGAATAGCCAQMVGFAVASYTLAGAITGPLFTCVFKMTNIAVGAGMGTSGLVGPIGTFTDMGFTFDTLWKVLLLQILLPAVLTLGIDWFLRRAGKIQDGDYKLAL